MHNLSDEELDRLSKEAADRYGAPQVQSTWEKLSRRLDEEMPQDKKDRKVIFWLALLLLLFGGGALYYYNQGSNGDKIKASNELVSSSRANNDKKIETPLPATKSPEQSAVVTDERPGETPGTKNPDVTSGSTRGTGKISGEGDPRHQATGIVTRGNSNSSKNNPRSKRGSASGTRKQNVVTEKETSQPEIQDENIDSKGAEDLAIVPAAKQPVQDPALKDKKDESVSVATQEDAAKPAEAKKSKKQGYATPVRKWEFGLVYGPDFSNVKFTHKDDVGLNVGVTIGYNFNRRLSVNTGFLYTKKNYTTSGENYKFPPGYWASRPNVKMNSVEASCYMFDIPLNVRYNVVAAKKYSIFASAGLSSYLMSEEKFNYYYTYQSYPYARSWTNDKSDNYFLSIGNLSIGYEQQISQAISIQAEPFFKFSLSEVGFGSVSLNSMGIFASVKYKPSFGTKRATGNK